MKNNVKNKIDKLYQQIREDNIVKQQNYIEKIKEEHPKLVEIENTLTDENARIALSILADGKIKSESKIKMELIKEKNEYLKNNNIPLNYDLVLYNCSKCNDTGFTDNEGVKKCDCYKNVAKKILLEQSQFHMLDKYNFKNFNSGYYPDEENEKKYGIKASPKKQIEGIKKVAKNFIENFDDSETKNILFMGKPGTGKTFMSGCIANELIKKGYFVLYYQSPDFFFKLSNYRMMINSFTPDPVRFDVAQIDYNNIINCDLLIIDDFGTETDNSNRQPDILSIMNKRIAENKKMIISTNLELKNLSSAYDERFLSRISGYFSMLKLAGDDIRYKLRK